MGDGLTFTGSGEIDNGMTVSLSYTLTKMTALELVRSDDRI